MSDLMPKVNKNKITKADKEIEKQLDLLDEFRSMILAGEISNFLIEAITNDQNFVMVNYCEDTFKGVGMLERGKFQLMSQPEQE